MGQALPAPSPPGSGGIQAELSAAKQVPRSAYSSLKKGHWFAYRPASPLPVDTRFDLQVGPGTPSTLGPVKTYAAEKFKMRTHGPFKFKRFDCSGSCGKDADFQLTFTTPLAKANVKSMIRVTPRPKKLRFQVDNDGWLYINLLFAVVPMMFVLPYFNRYFFRVTGRIYLGPMVTSLIFITVLISNTVFYLPL